MLYIFVDIKIDMLHLIETVKHNMPKNLRLALVSTIQFVAALQVNCVMYGLNSTACIIVWDRFT